MQITADSMGVYTKVLSLSLYQNFDVIRQWSVQWCLTAGPAFLQDLFDLWIVRARSFQFATRYFIGLLSVFSKVYSYNASAPTFCPLGDQTEKTKNKQKQKQNKTKQNKTKKTKQKKRNKTKQKDKNKTNQNKTK